MVIGHKPRMELIFSEHDCNAITQDPVCFGDEFSLPILLGNKYLI